MPKNITPQEAQRLIDLYNVFCKWCAKSPENNMDCISIYDDQSGELFRDSGEYGKKPKRMATWVDFENGVKEIEGMLEKQDD